MRTLIANGTIVTADGSYQGDVLVDGETIAQIGADLAAAGVTADETIDADRQVRHPGRHRRPHAHGAAVRRHLRQGHLRDRHPGGRVRRHDVASSTSPSSRRASRSTRASRSGSRKAEGNAVIDYGFHMIMSDVNDATLAEMDQLVAEGVPDFKLFTAYPGVFLSPDDHIFRAMQQTKKNGGLILMHAENGPVIDILAAEQVAAGVTDPIGHGLARDSRLEGEATSRMIRLAEIAGVPVYFVHMSAKEALDALDGGAQPRRHGLGRDLPAVPVPHAGRPRQRLRGRQVRVLAAAAHQGPRGRALERAQARRPPADRHGPLPVRLPRPEGDRAAATSARSPTGSPAWRSGSTSCTRRSSTGG